ncbi:MAG: hypothetical protein DME58_03465 [Verrucomicrobia bacterium]|nr:MAG: hypothetical protein DME58_03465 [Verrucomicrobiota bacterium]
MENIRYRLEWLALKSATKFLPLLSRKACYRLALLLIATAQAVFRKVARKSCISVEIKAHDELFLWN